MPTLSSLPRILFAAFFFSATASILSGRTWSDASGSFNLEAEFVRFDGEKVVLKAEGGREIAVEVAKLSGADQEHLKKLIAEMAATPDPPQTKPDPEPEPPKPTAPEEKPGSPDTKPSQLPGPPPDKIHILTPRIEAFIRENGFEPILPKPDTPIYADSLRAQRTWIAREWEEPLKKLAGGHKVDPVVFDYWKRALDFLYLHEKEPERNGLALKALVEEGNTIRSKNGCRDPLFHFCLFELRKIDSGGTYAGFAPDGIHGETFKVPYFKEIPHSLRGWIQIQIAIHHGERTKLHDFNISLGNAFAHFENAIKEGEFTPEDDHVYTRLVLWPVKQPMGTYTPRWKHNDGGKSYRKLAGLMRNTGPTEWSKLISRGIFDRHHASTASQWEWAREEGWPGFGAQKRISEESVLKAHELRPDRADAAALMLTSAEVADGRLWEWYKKSTAAEVDFPFSQTMMFHSLLPRFGGSYPKMFAFGMATASSEDYGNDLCTGIFDAVTKAAFDLPKTTPVDILLGNDLVREVTLKTALKMAKDPRRDYERARRLSMLAFIAQGSSEIGLASKALEFLDAPLHPDVTKLLLDESTDEVELRAMIALGLLPEAARHFNNAVDAKKIDETELARSLFGKAKEEAPDAPDAHALIDRYLFTLDLETKLLQSKDWIDIPISEGLPGWQVHSGRWSYQEPGVIAAVGIGGQAWISHRIRPPESYALRGRVRFDKKPKPYQLILIAPGAGGLIKPGTDAYTPFFGIGRRDPNFGRVEGFLRGMSTNSHHAKALGKDVDAASIPFEFHNEGGILTLIAGGKEVFSKVDPDTIGLRVKNPGKLQFGGLNFHPGNAYLIDQLQIRNLVKVE